MPISLSEITAAARASQSKFKAVKEEIAKVIVGQETLIDTMLLALLSDGHLLVEGVPGLAKTLAVTTLAKTISCDFNRVQFTPDLLPADLTGTSVYQPKEGTFTVKKGPIFTNILLADEINRAPAKVQSALLEVMQERQVTIQGETFRTGEPYLVMATQNPIEQEGTYLLPEAQTDRFMFKVLVSYPTRKDEKEILNRMGKIYNKPQVNAVITAKEILEARRVIDQIYVDDRISEYILSLVFATRSPQEYKVNISNLLQYGVSPRASIALKMAGKAYAFLQGQGYVDPHDIKMVAYEVLRHRLRRSYEAEAEEINTDDIITELLKSIKVP